MSSPPGPRIFVSYASADGLAPARQIRRRLEEAGFVLWQDLVVMQGGQDWWTQIEEAIRAQSVEHLVLIVTPSVLNRPVVRREVRLARQEGVLVTPVMGTDTLDMSALPRWIGHLHDLRYPEQWERLVTVLKGPSKLKRVPFMAPNLPEGFVPRFAEFEALKAQLLDARGDAVGITAALRGAGGYGKTVIANALRHDIDIQDAYFGIVTPATKLLYLVLRQVGGEWKMSPREWCAAKIQFASCSTIGSSQRDGQTGLAHKIPDRPFGAKGCQRFWHDSVRTSS